MNDAPERYKNTDRNRLLNKAMMDLDEIVNDHDPDVDTSIKNGVWDRLDKLALDLEANLPPTADVIRGMIKPLVWEVTAETEAGDLLTSGIYGIDLWTIKGQFYVMINGNELLDYLSGSVLWFETLKEAQAAANEHHENAILATLKGSDTYVEL